MYKFIGYIIVLMTLCGCINALSDKIEDAHNKVLDEVKVINDNYTDINEYCESLGLGEVYEELDISEQYNKILDELATP